MQFKMMFRPDLDPTKTGYSTDTDTGSGYRSVTVVPGLDRSYDGEGGLSVLPHSLFIFLLKISPPDQTLRPTCKFLILGIFYHTIFFSRKI